MTIYRIRSAVLRAAGHKIESEDKRYAEQRDPALRAGGAAMTAEEFEAVLVASGARAQVPAC